MFVCMYVCMKEYRLLPKHRKMDENSYADQFRLLEERMDQLDISKDSQETVRKIMSAILLMAELQFKENDNGVEAANKGTLSTGKIAGNILNILYT